MFSSVRGTRASPGAPPPEGPPQAARAKAPKASAWKRPRERANRLGRNETRAWIQVVRGTMTYRATPPARKKRTRRRSAHGSGAPVSDRHRGHRPRNSGPVAETRNEDDEATYARPVVAAPFPLARAPWGERTPWSFARCAGDAGQRPALHCRARFGRVVGTRFRRPRGPRNARRHVPTQPTPPQRHVPPAGPATATCDPPDDPASATCTSRRTCYCDMYPASRSRLSDM